MKRYRWFGMRPCGGRCKGELNPAFGCLMVLIVLAAIAAGALFGKFVL